MPLPRPCQMNAPEEINVYTDGSWIFPLKQFLGLGGAGIWWPARNLVDVPLSTAEEELAHGDCNAEGVRLFTSIGGFGGSSTRTELAAGVIAISSQGPVRLGTDSEAFRSNAVGIIESIKRSDRRKAQWKTTSDGDLWEHFFKAVAAKGAHSVRITKVKGHATEEQVAAGEVRSQGKSGNDAADAVADLGVKVHGEDLIKLGGLCRGRRKRYTRLVGNIQQHIVEAYQIHWQLKDREERLAGKAAYGEDRKKDKFERPKFVEPNECRKLRIQSTMGRFAGAKRKLQAAGDIEKFLRGLVIKPCAESERGITWVELSILFRMHGSVKPIPDAKDRALRRGTARQLIDSFKKQRRNVIEKLVYDGEEKSLFALLSLKTTPLRGVGVESHIPMLFFSVAITEGCQVALTDELLRLFTRPVRRTSRRSARVRLS